MLWAQKECYQGQRTQDYLSRLDLAEGESLYQICSEICAFYGEVIINRKFGVFHLVKRWFSGDQENRQVLIAGAGLDALGIEVTERYPRAKVFEIDEENMGIKSEMVPMSKDMPEGTIRFAEANLIDSSDVYRSLAACGWDPTQPTLLIFEGVSYYLSPESTRQLFRTLSPDRVIFEFLKHDELVAAERAEISRKVFGKIAAICRLDTITRYSYDEINGIMNPLSVTDKFSMKRLENMRTNANRFFPTEASGWIEVCYLESDREGNGNTKLPNLL